MGWKQASQQIGTQHAPLQLDRRALLVGTAGTAAALLVRPGAARAAVPEPHAAGPVLVARHGPTAAARWTRAAYDVVALQGLTPPSAARAYAAVAVACYEALVGGMPASISTQGRLAQLGGLPRTAAPGQVFWPSVVGAAASTVLRGLFPAIPDRGRSVLAEAESRDAEDARISGISPSRVSASTAHGSAVAHEIVRWVSGDGHADALARPYAPPTGPSLWVPTPPNFGTAIEPHCHLVRPMVLRTTDEVEPALPLPFSSQPGSAFWQDAMSTYRQSHENTDEQRDLARFWTDNPVFSGLPAGHWMSIVIQAAEQRGLALDTTVEALLLTAVTLHDAFLNCWTWKYRHNLLRPVTYVRRHVDPMWSTWVNTPQFPEHTSGHSVASRAAATVLTSLLGRFPVDDTARATTVGITRRTRSWADFFHAADSAARSRLYGGIHFPHGIEAGKAQGDAVGALVLARLTTRRYPTS